MKNQDLQDRTKAFALRVVRMCAALPKSAAAQVMGRQILRSGTSVGANYCEATHSRSKAEFVAKVGDCLKELAETAYWLELLMESKTLLPKKLTALYTESRELLAILTTISKKTKGAS